MSFPILRRFHYLILCGAEGVLPRLFERVIIPPTVFAELQQPNTPAAVQQWVRGLPAWVAVQKPTAADYRDDAVPLYLGYTECPD